MIKLERSGNYKIIETSEETRVLALDESENYAWVYAGGEIGEILVATKKKFVGHYTLVRGKYRLYEVEGELGLSTGFHLELYVGEGSWQGYLLPTGLPKNKNIRNKILPSSQIITQTSNLHLLA
ncbi:MAG: hypothetical protein Q8P13_01850 [bacterium]|nr:hypothetical protein [bacterium]